MKTEYKSFACVFIWISFPLTHVFYSFKLGLFFPQSPDPPWLSSSVSHLFSPHDPIGAFRQAKLLVVVPAIYLPFDNVFNLPDLSLTNDPR